MTNDIWQIQNDKLVENDYFLLFWLVHFLNFKFIHTILLLYNSCQTKNNTIIIHLDEKNFKTSNLPSLTSYSKVEMTSEILILFSGILTNNLGEFSIPCRCCFLFAVFCFVLFFKYSSLNKKDANCGLLGRQRTSD